MKVDYSTPLTEEERAYLEARGATGEIERADAINGVTNPPPYGEGDGTGLKMQPLLTSEAAAGEKERLMARLAQIEADEAKADTVDDETLPPYEEWNFSALKAEIDARNEGRDVKMPKTGSAADLAARLRQDDEQEQDPATQQV
jgi:hypothetical protein